MDDLVFDRALIRAAFDIAAAEGWPTVSVAKAARLSGLDVARARARFPTRLGVLARFGRLADQAALSDISTEGPARDRLFDMIMRRIDLHQAHRAGVLAVLRAAPFDPGSALLLGLGLRNSMGWMLEGAGVSTAGWQGEVRVQGLLGVWVWTIRAWSRDDSEDLSSTMAALDTALQRVERMSGWLPGGARPEAPIPPSAVPPAEPGLAGAPDPLSPEPEPPFEPLPPVEPPPSDPSPFDPPPTTP
jgi:hypothetical protein